MRILLILLLAVVLAGGGATATALAMTTDQWESDRVAAEQLSAAQAGLMDARADAEAEQQHLADLNAEGETLLGDARAFLALAPGWADAAALTALTAAADALELELARELPPGIRALDVESLAVDDALSATADVVAQMVAARSLAEGRTALLAAARDAVADLARAAATGGGASIAGMTLTTEEQRDAARGSLASLASEVRSGGAVLAALGSYTSAWVVLRDAQAAAQAAADAAAAAAAAAEAAAAETSTGGGPGLDIDWSLLLPNDAGPRPTIVDNGYYTQYCQSSTNVGQFELAGGSTYVVQLQQPYHWVLLPSRSWVLLLSVCD